MKLTRRQKEIIDNALKLTAQGGIQNLTIKNLASALGITEPAIYRHFKNKSEIVKAMIRNFEAGSETEWAGTGVAGVKAFVMDRFSVVTETPELAKVMFAEELFMDDPEYSTLLLEMMHRHKSALQKMFAEARDAGEIRDDISADLLFQLVFGPVRLLIKQWGMSRHGFSLMDAGKNLWDALELLLKKPR